MAPHGSARAGTGASAPLSTHPAPQKWVKTIEELLSEVMATVRRA
jgi:hypothetical protein